MKTVQSHVLSSDPISLSDATSFLSAHSVSGDGSVGASDQTCLFVQRALASFQELEQLHLSLKDKRSSESHNDDAETTAGDYLSQRFAASRDVTSKPRSHRHDDLIKVEIGYSSLKEDGVEIAEIDDQKKKSHIGENGGRIEEGDGENEMGKEKEKKKRDNVVENAGGMKEEEDVESKMGSEEVRRQEKKKKKMKKMKRKKEVLENSEVGSSEEQQEKRKKRRKS